MPITELVEITTSDGLRLHGVQQRQEYSHAPRVPFDAALLLHGTGSNFYSSRLLEVVADHLRSQGATVVRANTRGHDGVSMVPATAGSRRLGAAFETVDDCRYDLLGWLYHLRDQGHQRVAVVGHSLGAVKSIYALAQRPQPLVTHLIALSPPRLSHSFFAQSERGEEFAALMRQAEEHVAAGRGNSLMEVTFPLPYLVSAAGYVDKYGPAERYDLLKHLPGVACPTLITFGGQEIEREVAFQGQPDAINSLPPGPAPRTVAVVPGANHNYTQRHDELLAQIDAWRAGL